jgi:drug/metabolite transporter (DMT)-like permease
MAVMPGNGWLSPALFVMAPTATGTDSMQAKLTMTASDWLLLILLSVLWGASFFFVELAVDDIPPFTLALARCAVAAVFLLVYVRINGFALPQDAATWRSLAVLAALNTLFPFTLIFWGQTHITSSLASILNATAPLFSIVIAHLATSDERMTVPRAFGVVIGFVGTVMMIGVDALRDVGVHVLAQLAIVAAAFCYACSGVYGRRFKAYPPSVVSASIMMIGSAMLLPLSLAVDRPWMLPMPSGVALASMVGLGLISTGLAFLIYFRVLARAGAVNFQLVAFLIPVSAILLGVGVLGERLETRHIVGMAAIAVGLAIIDGRPLRALKRRFGRAQEA